MSDDIVLAVQAASALVAAAVKLVTHLASVPTSAAQFRIVLLDMPAESRQQLQVCVYNCMKSFVLRLLITNGFVFELSIVMYLNITGSGNTSAKYCYEILLQYFLDHCVEW